jgi:hypothetical protein
MQSSIFLPLWTDQIIKLFELIVGSFHQNYDAKISHFGLVKHGWIRDESHVSKRAVSRYTLPEYVTTGTMYSTSFLAQSS